MIYLQSDGVPIKHSEAEKKVTTIKVISSVKSNQFRTDVGDKDEYLKQKMEQVQRIVVIISFSTHPPAVPNNILEYYRVVTHQQHQRIILNIIKYSLSNSTNQKQHRIFQLGTQWVQAHGNMRTGQWDSWCWLDGQRMGVRG